MSNLTTYADQSVFDIALQVYGSIEGVFDLLKANAGLQLDSHIAPGTVLQVPGEPVKQEVVDYYAKNKIKPATGNVSGLFEYRKKDKTMIEKTYNYNLSGGDKAFAGIRLYNLFRDLDVQVNYTAINADDVEIRLQSSLDNLTYFDIPQVNYVLDKTMSSHIFHIFDLVTIYVRLVVKVGSATQGTIDNILIQL